MTNELPSHDVDDREAVRRFSRTVRWALNVMLVVVLAVVAFVVSLCVSGSLWRE